MTLYDRATLVLQNDVSGDEEPDTGVFDISTNLEVEKNIRTSFLLDNSLDRVLGAINELVGQDNASKRSGITIDTGGGESIHQISATIPDGTVILPDGSEASWGDGDEPYTDAKGDSARRKADVLERYVKTGTYDSSTPARLKFGEYNEDGVYEDFIPIAIQDISITISSETEQTIDLRMTVKEVGTLGNQDSAVARFFQF